METDADVESNAASSRPSSAHNRGKQRPATSLPRQVVHAASVPRPMTAPAIDYHSQPRQRPGTSSSSRHKSSGSQPRPRTEEETSEPYSPLAVTNGVSL